MAANKTIPTSKSAMDFINALEDSNKKSEALHLLKIMKDITKKEAVMWGDSLIGFDEYHYKYESGREGDFFITGFSPRKTALTVYIMTGFNRHEELISKLGKYKTGKSCLYIKKLADIDESVLKALIEESVQAMRNKYA